MFDASEALDAATAAIRRNPDVTRCHEVMGERCEDAIAGGLILWPKHPSLEAYRALLRGGGVTRALVVSVGLVVVGTAAQMLATVLLAYGLSKRGVPGSKLVLFLVIGALAAAIRAGETLGKALRESQRLRPPPRPDWRGRYFHVAAPGTAMAAAGAGRGPGPGDRHWLLVQGLSPTRHAQSRHGTGTPDPLPVAGILGGRAGDGLPCLGPDPVERDLPPAQPDQG